MAWLRLAEVQGSATRPYIIAVTDDKRTIGCSCKGWTMHARPGNVRKDCKHIRLLKDGLASPHGIDSSIVLQGGYAASAVIGALRRAAGIKVEVQQALQRDADARRGFINQAPPPRAEARPSPLPSLPAVRRADPIQSQSFDWNRSSKLDPRIDALYAGSITRAGLELDSGPEITAEEVNAIVQQATGRLVEIDDNFITRLRDVGEAARAENQDKASRIGRKT